MCGRENQKTRKERKPEKTLKTSELSGVLDWKVLDAGVKMRMCLLKRCACACSTTTFINLQFPHHSRCRMTRFFKTIPCGVPAGQDIARIASTTPWPLVYVAEAGGQIVFLSTAILSCERPSSADVILDFRPYGTYSQRWKTQEKKVE